MLFRISQNLLDASDNNTWGKKQASEPQRGFPRPWQLISSQKCCVSGEAGTEEPQGSPSPVPSTASLQILSLVSSKATLGVGSLPLTTRDKCTSPVLVPSPKVPGKASHGLCLGEARELTDATPVRH